MQFAAAEKVDPAPARPAVKEADAALDAQRSAGKDAPIEALEQAIEARVRVQADAAPYFTGSQILIDRAQYDQAIVWAGRGAAASDHFIDENVSAYQMSGKVQSQYARGRATAADLVGVALFLKKDYAGAAAKLEEAERLWQGLDFGNQLHLAELARARNDARCGAEPLPECVVTRRRFDACASGRDAHSGGVAAGRDGPGGVRCVAGRRTRRGGARSERLRRSRVWSIGRCRS